MSTLRRPTRQTPALMLGPSGPALVAHNRKSKRERKSKDFYYLWESLYDYSMRKQRKVGTTPASYPLSFRASWAWWGTMLWPLRPPHHLTLEFLSTNFLRTSSFGFLYLWWAREYQQKPINLDKQAQHHAIVCVIKDGEGQMPCQTSEITACCVQGTRVSASVRIPRKNKHNLNTMFSIGICTDPTRLLAV